MYANLQRFGCSTNTPANTDSGLCATRKGNFSNNYYWSSTEVQVGSGNYTTNAWYQLFNLGNQNFNHMANSLNVRAARAF